MNGMHACLGDEGKDRSDSELVRSFVHVCVSGSPLNVEQKGRDMGYGGEWYHFCFCLGKKKEKGKSPSE